MTREEFKERFPEWYQEMCELSEAIESAYQEAANDKRK